MLLSIDNLPKLGQRFPINPPILIPPHTSPYMHPIYLPFLDYLFYILVIDSSAQKDLALAEFGVYFMDLLDVGGGQGGGFAALG